MEVQNSSQAETPEVMIKKIHFFWLNINGPVGMSIGVSTLSHLLEQEGFDVKISHLCEHLGYPFDAGKIRRDVEGFGADLFAVSFSSTQFEYAKKLVGLIREQNEEALLFCGGIHSIAAPETVISIPGVDGACLCEADEVLPALVGRINRGDDWRATPGFWFKMRDGIKKNAVCPPPDISRSIAGNFNSIDYRTLVKHKSGFAEILLGRGCLFRCTFCQNCVLLDKYKKLPKDTRKRTPYLRVRDVDILVREMKMFIKAGKDVLKGFVFGDDSILYSREWLDSFLKAYTEEINYPFVACLIASQVEEGMSRRLFEAGCNVIRLGMETGNENTRIKLLRKPVGDKRLLKAAETLHRSGINVQGFGMLGLPGETEDDIFSLFRLAVDMKVDVFRVSMFVPLPGTPLYRHCLENDLLDTDGRYRDFGTESALKMPPGRRLFLDKVQHVFTWALNSRLPNPVGEWYGKKLRDVLDMEKRRWEGFRENLEAEEEELMKKAVECDLPHYYSPIAGRRDYAFLHLSSRRRKMINIDDGAGPQE